MSSFDVAASLFAGSHNPGKVRPVLDQALRLTSPEGLERNGSKSSARAVMPVDENEQLRIYKRKAVSYEGKSDHVIAGAIKRWRKSKYRHSAVEGSIVLSEACRGLVSPSVCQNVIADSNQKGRIILTGHEEVIARRVSRIYSEVVRRREEARYYRDVLYGPANGGGISEFERHLLISRHQGREI